MKSKPRKFCPECGKYFFNEPLDKNYEQICPCGWKVIRKKLITVDEYKLIILNRIRKEKLEKLNER